MSTPDPNAIATALQALTEPITKLIDTAAKAGYVVYEPTHIRRIAKANRDAAIIKAETELEIQELQRRSEVRIKARELRRQRNVESIIAKAVVALPATVNRDSVDEDWISQFFTYCEDVGNEEMQIIWARLLAGEVANPGTYSSRTLALVKVLQPEDARLFKFICNYMWRHTGGMLSHLYTTATNEYLAEKGFGFDSFMHLSDLNLINIDDMIGLNFGDTGITLAYFGDSYTLTKPPKKDIPDPGKLTDKEVTDMLDAEKEIEDILTDKQFTDPLYLRVLSKVGNELASLCETEPDENYRKLIVEHFQKLGMLPNSTTN